MANNAIVKKSISDIETIITNLDTVINSIVNTSSGVETESLTNINGLGDTDCLSSLNLIKKEFENIKTGLSNYINDSNQ